MDDERKDGGGMAVFVAAGCLVVVVGLIAAVGGWVVIRSRFAAEQELMLREDMQAELEQALAAQQEAIAKSQQEREAAQPAKNE
ncbi:MAG TPA: hypothetical protein VFB80_21550 [Pirellulaceae bacterium]|nr:hypothetical protein [Pirellulaceae bacterium]